MSMIRLLIADDHQVMLDGLVSIIEKADDISVAATASNGKEVLHLIAENGIDVALLDINMPELNGVETCKKLSRKYPHVKVVALSMYKKSSYIQRMLQFGAKGYILKDDRADEILDAVRQVHQGHLYFSSQIEPNLLSFTKSKGSNSSAITQRELEVLQCISRGMTNAEIAEALFISQHTAESHRKNLLSKLDARNTADLVRISMEKGLI